MKRGSAPLRMAWELVSGLPVSTQPGWGRLMYCMRMRGQMGGKEEMDGTGIEKKEGRTGDDNTFIRGGQMWVYYSLYTYLMNDRWRILFLICDELAKKLINIMTSAAA